MDSGVHILETVFLEVFTDFSTRSEGSSQNPKVVGMGPVLKKNEEGGDVCTCKDPHLF